MRSAVAGGIIYLILIDLGPDRLSRMLEVIFPHPEEVVFIHGLQLIRKECMIY